MTTQLDEVLHACIAPLRPYLGQLVIAGGWVPYLYTKLYEGSVANAPLLTTDFDVALVRRSLIEGDVTLDESILNSGFTYDFASLDKPPVVKYVKHLKNGSQAEIEFITDAAGAVGRVEVIGSVNAQALQDVDLLLDRPWALPLARFGDLGEGELCLPRPSRFVLHKVLVAPRRGRWEKTAKDLYYAFYTLDCFPLWRSQMLEEVSAFSGEDPKRAVRTASYLSRVFESVDAEGATLLASQRPQTAYGVMDDDQFRLYALTRMRQLLSALEK